jgi:hypothetical protein
VGIGLVAWLSLGPSFAAEKLVRLSPMKGIIIGVPKGWKACDLFFDQKLGKADDPHGIAKKICEINPRNNPTVKLGAFWPGSPGGSKLTVLYMNRSPTSAQTIKGLTQPQLDNVAKTTCEEWKKTASRDGTKLESCAVRKDELDNKPALVTAVIQTADDPSQGQSFTEVWEVPFENGFAQFNFSGPKDRAGDFERIKDSIELE